MIINNLDFLENLKFSFENKAKTFELSQEDINFLKTFNNYLKSETISSLGIYSTDKKKLIRIQQILVAIVSLSSISNQFLVHKKNSSNDYSSHINNFFIIGNQRCRFLRIFDLGSEKIVEYEILNLATKRKKLKNKNTATIQEPLRKFESKNPEFSRDNKAFKSIKKEAVTISDVNKSIEFENDWLNLLLDPVDVYPDTNINLKKNSFTISCLATAQNIRNLKKIIIGTKKKDESKNLSDLLLFNGGNSKDSLCPHVLHSSSLENLESNISLEAFTPSILFIQTSKMLINSLDDSFYNKYKKKIVFLEPNDLGKKNDNLKTNIEILRDYGFKFIDIGNFNEPSMKLIGKVTPVQSIYIYKFNEPLIPRIYKLIKQISEDGRFLHYCPNFYKIAYRTLSSLFKSPDFIKQKSEEFEVEIDKLLSHGYSAEAKLLQSIKEVLVPYMELMRISKDNPGMRLKVFIDYILPSIQGSRKGPNLRTTSDGANLYVKSLEVAIVYDKKESFFSENEIQSLSSFFSGKNIGISFYDINAIFDDGFSPYAVVFPNLLKNDISTMINIQANKKFLILDQNEFKKFDKIRSEFIETKKIIKLHEFSFSNENDTNFFDNFKVSIDSLTNSPNTELIERNIINTYSIINQKENVSDFDRKWDYEELDHNRNFEMRQVDNSFNYTREAYMFNFRLEKSNYQFICEKGHSVLLYDMDDECFYTKKIEKIPELSGSFKVLLPINWNKELRFKISDEILRKAGLDLVKIQNDISLWKDAFKSFALSEGDIERVSEVIPNINLSTVKRYLYDNELIGPGQSHQTHDYLTKIFSASSLDGLKVDEELVLSVENSIRESRKARKRVQGFINKRVERNINMNNTIYSDELIGEIGSFDFINCNLNDRINATQDMINKLTKERF
jgi:hypothetical protein